MTEAKRNKNRTNENSNDELEASQDEWLIMLDWNNKIIDVGWATSGGG